MTDLNQDLFYSLIKEAFEERWAKGEDIKSTFLTLFRCEADLQFCLASKLEQKFKNAGIYLEYRVRIRNKDVSNFSHPIDIVVVINGEKYAIELKYSAYDYRKRGSHFAGTESCRDGFQADIDIVKALLGKENDSRYAYNSVENKDEGREITFKKGFCLFFTNNKKVFTDYKEFSQYPSSAEIEDQMLNAPFRLITVEISK